MDAATRRGRMRIIAAGYNQEVMGVLLFNGIPPWEAAVTAEVVRGLLSDYLFTQRQEEKRNTAV